MNDFDLTSLGYDVAATQPATSQFDALPAGEYMAMIVQTPERAMTKSGGQMFKMQFKLIDGQYANRIIFHNCNVVNANPKAEQIGREQIASMQVATGCHGSTNLLDIMNKPMIIKLNKKNDPQYGEQNNIVAWKPANGAQPAQAQTQQTAQQPAQQAQPASNTPAWAQ